MWSLWVWPEVIALNGIYGKIIFMTSHLKKVSFQKLALKKLALKPWTAVQGLFLGLRCLGNIEDGAWLRVMPDRKDSTNFENI